MNKVYKYGLYMGNKILIDNENLVREQMFNSHIYYNKLVEIENDRRNFLRKAACDINHKILELQNKKEELYAQISSIRNDVAKKHIKDRNKETSIEEQNKILEVKKLAKNVQNELSSLYKDLYKNPLYKEQENIATEKFGKPGSSNKGGIAVKSARKLNNIYWGTGALIERAVAKAIKDTPFYRNLKFKRWDGNSQIGVQIQTEAGKAPLYTSEIYNEKNTQVRIEKEPLFSEFKTRSDKRKGCRTFLYIRVSSDKKKPIWAKFPMIMDRKLPDDAKITNVVVCCDKFGPREEWTVNFTVNLNDENTILNNKNIIAIDIGWRKIDNDIRVACLIGNDYKDSDKIFICKSISDLDKINNFSKIEIRLPEEHIKYVQKVNDLKQIRDKLFNETKEKLLSWAKENNISEWLKEEIKYLYNWKSNEKIIRLIKKWKENRFDGDVEIYNLLEKWKYRDYHLWTWECNQRKKALRRRKEFYRNVSSKLREKYNIIIMEDFNKNKVSQKPEVEKNCEDNEAARSNRYIVATSELCECLKQSFTKVGGFEEINPKNTSKMCSNCENIENIGKKLIHTCSSCNKTYDRDFNSVINILKLGSERLSDEQNPRTAREREKPKGNAGLYTDPALQVLAGGVL